MQRRTVRYTIVALLLLVGAGAAFVFSSTLAQLRSLDADRRAVATTLSQLGIATAEIDGAHAGYLAPGAALDTLIGRVNNNAQALSTGMATVRSTARSVDAAPELARMRDALSRLLASDTAARDALTEGQDGLAADYLAAARQASDTIAASVKTLAAAEDAAFDAEQAALDQQLPLIPGGAALLAFVGLLLLAKPANAALPMPVAPVPQPSYEPRVETPMALDSPGVDLAEAAAVCTVLSRLTESAALPDLLARAATVLDASGIIIWMGAGDELFAATAHGYDPRVISRLGAIPRSADNATAAAWREGTTHTVPGDMMSNGAIVAPMFGPEACIGVLAAEVRHGREADPAARAVTAMIAAQLATVVAAWPAASTALPRAAHA